MEALEPSGVGDGLLSERARQVAARPRYRLVELAAQYTNVISMGRGDPDQDTPRHIIEAAQRALDSGETHYTLVPGLLELREAVADKLARDNGILYDPGSEILVTSGGQEAIYIAIQALINPGDEVLITDPRYTAYDHAVTMAGGTLVTVPTYEERNFEVTASDIARRLTSRAKLLVLVSPNNPTGNVLSQPVLEDIAELARERGLLVLSDEIYEKLVFDNARHLSIASLPGMKGRTIVVNGFSKTYNMTGWRIGYLAAPVELMPAMVTIKQTVNICAPVVAQRAAIAALMGPQDCVEETVRIYDERRRYFMAALGEMGLSYGYPQGTFCVFTNISSTGMPSPDFALTLLQEEQVLVFPGTEFGDQGEQYLRFSLLQPMPILREGVERLRRVVTRHRAQ